MNVSQYYFYHMTQPYYIKHRGPRTVVEPAKLGVPGVAVMAEQTLLQSERNLPPHFHKDQMEICYFVSGERLYSISGEVYKVGANQVFITWPNEIHWVDAAPYGKALFYYIRVKLPRNPGRYMGLAAQEAATLVEALRDMPRRHFDLDASMRKMLTEAFDIARGEPSKTLGLDLALTLSRWLLLLTRFAGRKPEDGISPDIARSLEIMRTVAAELTCVGELAEAVGLSPSRFKAKFKQEVGLSPWEYVLRRKVFLGGQMLRKGGENVTRVAMRLGFASSQHFASTFRRFTGLTPTAFVRQGGGTQSPKGGYGHADKWVDEGIVHGYVLG